MCKYKVGDVVKIKSWDTMEKEYGLIYFPKLNEKCINLGLVYFLSEMKKFCGQKVTIDCVLSNSYYIREDNGLYVWTDSMFEQGV